MTVQANNLIQASPLDLRDAFIKVERPQPLNPVEIEPPKLNGVGQRRLKAETTPRLFLYQNLVANAGDAEIAKILVTYGGDPQTVVFRAAGNGDLTSVKKLIEYGVSVYDPVYKMNVLDYSLKSRNVDLMKYLIDERGLKSSLYNPFDSFIRGGVPFFAGIDLMLSKGYVFSNDIIANLLNCYGKRTTIEDLKGLVERGAKTDCLKNAVVASQILNSIFGESCRGPFGGPSPYQLLSINKELLNFLLSYDINVNVDIGKIKDSNTITYQKYNSKAFSTPLLIAIASNDKELLKDLIRCGADVNLPGKQWGVFKRPVYNSEGMDELSSITPIKLAMELKNQELVVFLLENGAKI
jgi:hypothetical protein